MRIKLLALMVLFAGGLLPTFGQEEDAAGVLSILMIDQVYDEESAKILLMMPRSGF